MNIEIMKLQQEITDKNSISMNRQSNAEASSEKRININNLISRYKKEKAKEHLISNKVDVLDGTDDEAKSRSVGGLIKFSDPSGNPIEIYYEPTLDYKFSSPIPDHSFVASSFGLGHVMILAANREQTFDFYTKKAKN